MPSTSVVKLDQSAYPISIEIYYPLKTSTSEDRKELNSSTESKKTLNPFYKLSGPLTASVDKESTTVSQDNLNESDITNSDTPSVPIEVDSIAILGSMISNEDVESGITNPSERYFEAMMDKDRLAALNSISTLFMNNYSSAKNKVSILVGILHIVSHFDYWSVYPSGQMMAVNALSHDNKEVNEYGVKCFENWENPDCIEKLEAVHYSSQWLQEYVDDVIQELREVN